MWDILRKNLYAYDVEWHRSNWCLVFLFTHSVLLALCLVKSILELVFLYLDFVMVVHCLSIGQSIFIKEESPGICSRDNTFPMLNAWNERSISTSLHHIWVFLMQCALLIENDEYRKIFSDFIVFKILPTSLQKQGLCRRLTKHMLRPEPVSS